MKNLPIALLLEKNKLASPDPWLLLFDITLPDASTVYLARNTQNVSLQGHTYLAFPCELDPMSDGSKGELPTLTLRVSNVLQTFQAYLEQYNGLVESAVLLRVVHAAHLAEDYSEREMSFDILAASSDSQWISFMLGASNPLKDNFPTYRYLADGCRWKFKSAECAYAGAASTCERTLDACRQLSNSPRFGGFPGLSGGGVRLA